MTAIDTRTLDAPGAAITYDIRGGLGAATADAPVLMLVGSPMDASGFTTLASYFTDRPVVTYDPRGTGRSVRSDGTGELVPQQHAADLHRVIAALGADRVDLFGSSGGAVNGLALVAEHPEQVRTLVAHEPPTARVLPDREQVLAVCEAIHRTYETRGMGPAMAKFIDFTGQVGPIPGTYADEPGPDPASFGLPTEDDGSRGDPLLGQNLRGCTAYRPDFEALAAAPTRIVAALGRESEGTMAARGAGGVAQGLGGEPAVFPSHHAGFLGDEYSEYGMSGDPEGFAAKLRQVLAQT
ncbi:alpha/beta hydrolase [Streptomonospora sediminis]